MNDLLLVLDDEQRRHGNADDESDDGDADGDGDRLVPLL